MKRVLFFLTVVLAVGVAASLAQNLSTTRLEKQHGASHFQKSHLKQTEASLLMSLDSTWQGDQQAAIQTVRDLEQMFPTYEFASLIKPLERILKDANGDPVARRLAALALDELHSDAGDAVIYDVASASDDKGLQTLCKALQVGSGKTLGSSK